MTWAGHLGRCSMNASERSRMRPGMRLRAQQSGQRPAGGRATFDPRSNLGERRTERLPTVLQTKPKGASTWHSS